MSDRDLLHGWMRCARCASEYRVELIKGHLATGTHCPLCVRASDRERASDAEAVIYFIRYQLDYNLDPWQEQFIRGVLTGEINELSTKEIS